MHDPSWHLYRTFLAVLETGSLSGGAKKLGLTQPTAGRHIEELEQALNRSLFTRSPQGLLALEAASSLKPYAEAMAAAAAAMIRHAGSNADSYEGSVRITASHVIGVEVLPGIIAELQNDHPAVSVELSTSDTVENLLRQDADIAVRMTEPQQDALLVRYIGTVELGFYAHKIYLEKHGAPENVEDLDRHKLIGFDTPTSFTRASLQFLRQAAPGFPDEADLKWVFRTDNAQAQLKALRLGIGIGICQCPIADRQDDLVRLFPDVALPLKIWVAMHEDLKLSPLCRLTFNTLVAGLLAYISGRPNG